MPEAMTYHEAGVTRQFVTPEAMTYSIRVGFTSVR